MTRGLRPLLATVLVATAIGARAEEPVAWSGPVRTGTILAGDVALFSYELRQTDPLKLPLVRELIVCRPRGELYRIRVTSRKEHYTLELGYHSRVKPVEPEVFIGPVPTKDAPIPRVPEDTAGLFTVPLTKLRAGSEELEFFVPMDFFVPTVQRWLEETWRGTSRDLPQALNDVLVASRLVPFGMGEDVTSLLGVAPTAELSQALIDVLARPKPEASGKDEGRTMKSFLQLLPKAELKDYAEGRKLRRVERSPDFCSGP
ncbi:MAG: hypothetical protein ACYDBY_17175 [Thermoanaerobaculia bacterium]